MPLGRCRLGPCLSAGRFFYQRLVEFMARYLPRVCGEPRAAGDPCVEGLAGMCGGGKLWAPGEECQDRSLL